MIVTHGTSSVRHSFGALGNGALKCKVANPYMYALYGTRSTLRLVSVLVTMHDGQLAEIDHKMRNLVTHFQGQGYSSLDQRHSLHSRLVGSRDDGGGHTAVVATRPMK